MIIGRDMSIIVGAGLRRCGVCSQLWEAEVLVAERGDCAVVVVESAVGGQGGVCVGAPGRHVVAGAAFAG